LGRGVAERHIYGVAGDAAAEIGAHVLGHVARRK
jgi:hypothetical protein